MKKGNYAIFKGKEYSADYIKGKGIVLRSEDEDDLERGFELYTGYNKKIVCIKFVEKKEISEFFKIKIKAMYAGFEFEVVEENNNTISIVAMTGDYRNWLDIGMKCIDKGVYQKWIDKSEAEIKIIKEDLM